LGAYLYRTMKPPVPELSLHPDGSLRDAERHQLRRCKHIAAIRFDGPLNFANTSYLEDKVLEMVAEMSDLRYVLIAAHGINEVDASGEDMLRLLVDRLRDSGYEVCVSGMKDKVQDALTRTGLFERIGEQNMFPTQALAVAAIHAKAHINSTEKDCPLQQMRPRVVTLSLHPDGSLRDTKRYGLKQCRHIAAIRFNGSLDIASSVYLEESVNERVATMPELRHVLIAAHGINQIDTYGVETLARVIRMVREAGYEISFSGFSDIVLDLLKRFHIYEVIGEENIYPTQVLAVRRIYADAHVDSEEKTCPLAALQPRVAELSLHPDGSLRDAHRRGLRQCEHIAALRFDGPLDMASADFLVEKVEERVAAAPKLKHVLFAAHRITLIDDHGVDVLEKLVRWLRDSSFEVSFSGLADSILDVLKERNLYEIIESTNIYPTQVLAIRHIYDRAHEDSDEKDCPLRPLKPYVAELSLHPDGSLRDARRHDLDQCECITALRLDGPLDMAGAQYLLEKVEERVASMPKLRSVFFACHRINQIDAHGAEALRKVVRWLRDSGYEVSFSGLGDDVLDVLKDKNVYGVIGEDHIHPTQVQAIRNIYSGAHSKTAEVACPLESMRPYMAELSLHVDGSFRDARRYGLEQCEYIAALRFDGPLDLASADYLEEKIEEHIASRAHLKHVFFAAHRMNKIDTQGVTVLGRVLKRLHDSGYGVSFSGLTDDALDMLKGNHLYEIIGEHNIYPTQAVAIERIHSQAHESSNEKVCPLLEVVPRQEGSEDL
jgi:anti-anti-sigma factor